MPTVAVIGVRPGMGLSIARTFGKRGFDVALIARTKGKLENLVEQLGQEGITAAAFPADVLDRPSITETKKPVATPTHSSPTPSASHLTCGRSPRRRRARCR